MSEDLSAMVRTGVTYILLSCVTIFVVVGVILASQNLSRVVAMNSENVVMMEQSTLVECSGKHMSGAACYRICSDYQGAIVPGKFKILVDGNTYYNVEDLVTKKLFNRTYYFNSTCIDGAMWHITLEAID